MSAPYLHAILSGTATEVSPRWQKYFEDDFLPSLLRDEAVSEGALYDIIPNPMRRPVPDESTSLVLLESANLRCLQSKDVHEAGRRSASLVDSRSYQSIDAFDPKDLGPVGESIVEKSSPVIECKELIIFLTCPVHLSFRRRLNPQILTNMSSTIGHHNN